MNSLNETVLLRNKLKICQEFIGWKEMRGFLPVFINYSLQSKKSVNSVQKITVSQ